MNPSGALPNPNEHKQWIDRDRESHMTVTLVVKPTSLRYAVGTRPMCQWEVAVITSVALTFLSG